MKTILTGFGPFLTHEVNPTEIIVGDLVAPAEVELFRRILPVDFQKIEPNYTDFLDAIQPDLIINTGLNASKGAVQLEYVALNIGMDQQPNKQFFEPIPGNEAALTSQLPVDDMVSHLCQQGIPTIRSNHAGTYLCNYLYYLSLQWCKVNTGNALFIHVPYTSEIASQIALINKHIVPSLPQAMIEQALMETMIKCRDVACNVSKKKEDNV